MNKEEKEMLQKKLLDELQTMPIISIACKKVGIPKATFYRWKNDFPEFENQCLLCKSMGKDNINDLAESSLIKCIKDGEFRSIKFWLEANHPNYRYNKNSVFTYDDHEKIEKERKLLKKLMDLAVDSAKDDVPVEKDEEILEKEKRTFLNKNKD